MVNPMSNRSGPEAVLKMMIPAFLIPESATGISEKGKVPTFGFDLPNECVSVDWNNHPWRKDVDGKEQRFQTADQGNFLDSRLERTVRRDPNGLRIGHQSSGIIPLVGKFLGFGQEINEIQLRFDLQHRCSSVKKDGSLPRESNPNRRFTRALLCH